MLLVNSRNLTKTIKRGKVVKHEVIGVKPDAGGCRAIRFGCET